MTEKTEIITQIASIFPENPGGWYQKDFADLSVLARYLVDYARQDKTESFEQLFSIVENGVIEGNPETREFLIVELLESLKNFSSWQDLDYEIFEPWLGPETHIAWRWLEKKWLGKTSLADTVRKETGES